MNKNNRKIMSWLFSVLLTLLTACAVLNPPEVTELPEVRSELISLQCTEIHYNPIGTDSTNAQEHEFIEFKNTSDLPISLDAVAITNGIDYTFPSGTQLEPGAFIVLASNNTFFSARYGFSPFGIYSGKLSNSGEKITLKDLKADKSFLSITYNDKNPWPKAADGGGQSLVVVSPNLPGDPNKVSSWRASFRTNGSPGADDPGIVLVNEVLTHTDLPQLDAVELYNPNNQPVDVGNWFLTDRMVDPMKYRIPAGTTVPANGFLVINESQFYKDSAHSSSFRFSEHGEEVYLFSDSTGIRSGGYYDGFTFGAVDNGISFGRYTISTGQIEFVAQKAVSLGEKNIGPLVGPVVITEIMYHSSDDLSDFIELKNIGDSEVFLYDSDFPTHTWNIGGIGFTFPQNITIKPGEIILIASNTVTLDNFKAQYSVPAGIQVFSFTGTLSNSSDSITLLKPEEPYLASANAVTTTTPYMLREVVVFSDGGEWPKEADGTGSSLHRIDQNAYANDPANWKAEVPTAGR